MLLFWADWAVHKIYYYFFLFRDGQNIAKGTGQNLLMESDPLWGHGVPEKLTSWYCLTAFNKLTTISCMMTNWKRNNRLNFCINRFKCNVNRTCVNVSNLYFMYFKLQFFIQTLLLFKLFYYFDQFYLIVTLFFFIVLSEMILFWEVVLKIELLSLQSKSTQSLTGFYVCFCACMLVAWAFVTLYLDSKLCLMNNDRDTLFSHSVLILVCGRPQENVAIQSPFWLLQHFLISLKLTFSLLVLLLHCRSQSLSRSFQSLCIELSSLKYKFDWNWSQVTSVIISSHTCIHSDQSLMLKWSAPPLFSQASRFPGKFENCVQGKCDWKSKTTLQWISF